MNLLYRCLSSPVGVLKLVASERSLVGIFWERDDPQRVPLANLVRDDEHDILLETERQLQEYFDGERTAFSLPIELRGTAFQQDVWRVLQTIPFGETLTYGEIAHGLGNPGASRAVGAANGRNPLSIVVPCHRVLGAPSNGAAGKLTGFAGGLAAKAYLLDLESSNRMLFPSQNL